MPVDTDNRGIPQPACRVGDMLTTFQERREEYFLMAG
jgi:hypothetical protein